MFFLKGKVMKKATNKLLNYECEYYEVSEANVVLFWVDGRKNIWLGIADFFDHFTVNK